jgi:hypothetical protein
VSKTTRRRVLAASALGVAGIAALWPASADAGVYRVVQCHAGAGNAAAPDARSFNPTGNYSVTDNCGRGGALRIRTRRIATQGDAARISWQAPSGAAIVGVAFDRDLKNEEGHRAKAYVADDPGRPAPLLSEGTESGWRTVRAAVPPRAGFHVVLLCNRAAGQGQLCPGEEGAPWARAAVQDIELTFSDRVAPAIESFAGDLLAGGWRRGAQGVEVAAVDRGAGIRRLELRVNGVAVDAPVFSCPGLIGATGLASRLQPCGTYQRYRRVLDTSAPPFRDGQNAVRACVQDWAPAGANGACSEGVVAVDNSPPALAFVSRQDPADPDRIRARAPDPHSGLAGGQIHYRPRGSERWRPLPTAAAAGELRARVDSQAEQPGAYEFRAVAWDSAGNRAESRRRADGAPMVLRFPLRAQTALSAHLAGAGPRLVVPYGERAAVTGRLLDAHGRPLADQRLRVVERFAQGALVGRRARYVSTDGRGRFRVRLQRGPSRRIAASYPGSRRYGPAFRGGMALVVRGAVALSVSDRSVPEGEAVIFRGRVPHLGAAIPSGGKLIELQVREDGRWETVREAFRTGERGRYRRRYRFGDFYDEPVSYRFRVKVARETDWPYAAPAVSRRRRVTVVPVR